MKKTTQSKLTQYLPWVLAIGGAIGFLAAFIITIDKIELLKNPAFVPSCNLSPLLSCGSVMTTPQASIFGFANSLLGIGGFAIVTTIGMAMLAGANFKRWFWLGLQGGTIFGIGFVIWLISQSVFTIGKLCPYCMVVWTVMIPIFVYTTLYNLQEGHITVPSQLKATSQFLQRHSLDIVLGLYITAIAIILVQFWSYWSTFI